MDSQGYPAICEVCGNPGRKRQSKRVLCGKCWAAASGFTPTSEWSVDTGGNVWYPGKRVPQAPPPKKD